MYVYTLNGCARGTIATEFGGRLVDSFRKYGGYILRGLRIHIDMKYEGERFWWIGKYFHRVWTNARMVVRDLHLTNTSRSHRCTWKYYLRYCDVVYRAILSRRWNRAAMTDVISM